MWTFHPDLLARAVPRYTSFPTAAEFTPAVGEAELDGALADARGDVSLYLHIPFCEQICWYCGCNTGASNRRTRLTAYLDALHQEIALVSGRLDPSVRVRRVAFGGGSPNAIPPTDFVRLVDALTLHFDLDRPTWSIELDPRTLTAPWAATLGGVGVSNASLGVQTFSPRLQAAIGRVQPEETIVLAVERLRRAGIRSLNFDLMYGLPGQGLADLEASLARTAALGADRVALFGYAHVPHMLPRQRRIDANALPDAPERFAMAAFGYDWFNAHGYEPVGFDHFALPADPLAQAAREGRLHRNFQGFTDDASPVLIGLGASAISQFPEAIVQNEKNAGRYRALVAEGRLTGALGLTRSADDRRRGAAIESLLCHGHARLDADLAVDVAEGLAPFAARGLVALDNGRLVLRPEGLPYARSIAALLDPYRQHSPVRFSSAV